MTRQRTTQVNDVVQAVIEVMGPQAGEKDISLEADMADLIARFNRAEDGTMVVPSEYLEAVIITPDAG